ncbi:MAG TPA: proline iminopeptidase-family hydrolase [Verrucomicrobiae bacterium]|jgi:proline iminopeptidase|nr:proline iminopeptidase-family hydrolase [Verrucomicrobiae bacterium]
MKSLYFALTCSLALVSAIAQSQKPKTQSHEAAGVYRVDEGFVDARGVFIYYKILGRGAPLLIVHGGPGASHDYLLPHLLPLARTNRLIFIDERGSGRSQKLEDASQYTVENMVEDVEDVRQALGLGKISLMGHSYGGVLAQAYALKYQKNLTHLILGSTFQSTAAINEVLAKMKQNMPADERERLEALEKAGLFGKGKDWEKNRYPEDYAKLAWGDGYFPFLYQRRPDPNYDPLSGNTSTAWDLYREMWGSHGEFVIDGNLKSVEYTDRLSTIHVPTLVICGDHDESDPSLSRTMHEKIAGSKLVIVPQSGHMVFVDQPMIYLKAIDDFLHGR